MFGALQEDLCFDDIDPRDFDADAVADVPTSGPKGLELVVPAPGSEELVSNILALPDEQLSDYVMRHARLIDDLSRSALPDAGAKHGARSWIPRAPIHALFVRLGRFSGQSAPSGVSRAFMRVFRDREITILHIVTLLRQRGLATLPAMSGGGDVTSWVRTLRASSESDSGFTMGEVIALERQDLVRRALTMDPGEFASPLAAAGVDVHAWLDEIYGTFEAGILSRSMEVLADAHHRSVYQEPQSIGGPGWCGFMQNRFLQNCAMECFWRAHDQVSVELGRPPARPSGSLGSSVEEWTTELRNFVIGELAKNYNFRRTATGYLGDDIFGIRPGEIEEELERQKQALKAELDLYFDLGATRRKESAAA
jgi:hypothetical protein